MQRARQAVATSIDLLGYDLLEGALWMDVRKAQNKDRSFGQAPTRVWSALRKIVPLQADSAAAQSDAMVAASFVHTTDPAIFYTDELPRDGDKTALDAVRCHGP